MNSSVRKEYEGHFFFFFLQVCKLYNFSPKTLKRREKDGSIPIPPRIEVGKNRFRYRTDATFKCLEKISKGAI